MGQKFRHWQINADTKPRNLGDLVGIIRGNRRFQPVEKLDYGDHGLTAIAEKIAALIKRNGRIALYADYDVDGTMSCVSWLWFLKAIGHSNCIHYIPCRFKEGYGVNLAAVKYLVEEQHADLIITMDTGITANDEAAYCRERGVEFICTDHHKIQPEKMPDSLILNPKMHPNPDYQELCGCGITFVLLRKLAQHFPVLTQVAEHQNLWTDLLALAGMATICDVVPLNGVNHALARRGVQAILQSKRPILKRLRESASIAPNGSNASGSVDEKDVGFRLGPRINAVGRLAHADLIVKAFVNEDPEELVYEMAACNERRKRIQQAILEEATRAAAVHAERPVLVLGGDWHPGVVGIAAGKIAETFWRPTWLFQRKDGVCKGSARTIRGFDVTDAMSAYGGLFKKFGGHAAAGGFSFDVENEEEIRRGLEEHGARLRQEQPDIWESRLAVDCELPEELLTLDLVSQFDELKPFGFGFEEPRFLLNAEVMGVRFFDDKISGEPRHTSVTIRGPHGPQRVMFFNEVIAGIRKGAQARFAVGIGRNTYKGIESLSLTGVDIDLSAV